MIKQNFKRWFRNVVVLLALDYFYLGFEISGGLKPYLIAALILFFVQIFLHPLLKVLYLPINIITLGMFSWLLVAVHLLIVAFLMSTVEFLPFTFQGFSIFGAEIPAGEINLIFSVVLGTVIYRFIRKIVSLIS